MPLDELGPFEHGVCARNLRRLDRLECDPSRELDTFSGGGAQRLAAITHRRHPVNAYWRIRGRTKRSGAA